MTNPNVAFKYSPCDLSSGFVIATNTETKNIADGQSLIQNVSITFAGQTYPQAIYNLQTSTSAANVVGTTNDLFKAFTDYTVFSDSGYCDRSGSLMIYSEWSNQQMYVFKTKQTLNNTSGNCYDTVNCTAPVTIPTNILVLGLYDEYLSLTFDELFRMEQPANLRLQNNTNVK